MRPKGVEDGGTERVSVAAANAFNVSEQRHGHDGRQNNVTSGLGALMPLTRS